MPDAVRFNALGVDSPHAELVLALGEWVELERAVAGRHVLQRLLAHLSVGAEALELDREPERLVSKADFRVVVVGDEERNGHLLARLDCRRYVVGGDVRILEVVWRDVPPALLVVRQLPDVRRIGEFAGNHRISKNSRRQGDGSACEKDSLDSH